ncbi:MAG: DUF6503 family protein [Verrucomicrobiota bacterium]|nr:DUF6503 family protein [Verrucomicrobiota bacterium]
MGLARLHPAEHDDQMKWFGLICIFLAAGTRAPAEDATALADAVVAASGGDRWSQARAIDFTFNAAQGDKVLASATHHWDIWKNTDTVTWKGKTITVNLAEKNDAGDAKEGYARWVNDSYWLMAPLKLRDRGTNLTAKGEQTIDGKKLLVLQMAFEKIGLTPGDKYNFYIDPETHLVRQWDYMPSAEKKTTASWENYQNFSGVQLATERKMGDKRIYFTNVKVSID